MDKNTEKFVPTFDHLHCILLYVPEDEFKLAVDDQYMLQIYGGQYQCNFCKKNEYGEFVSIMSFIWIDNDGDYEVFKPTKVNIISVDKKGYVDYNSSHIFDIKDKMITKDVMEAAKISKEDLDALERFMNGMNKTISAF